MEIILCNEFHPLQAGIFLSDDQIAGIKKTRRSGRHMEMTTPGKSVLTAHH